MNVLKIAIVGFGALTMVGCATNGDVRTAKEEAMLSASDANRKAEQALEMARDAKQAAQEANARSQRNEEMLNRGFKRSMYK